MQKDKAIKLVCKSVWYYSKIDEEYFFDWLDRIKSIEKIQGAGDELYLYVKKKMPDDDLRELLALFYRYKLDMSQLKQLLNKDNKDWFFGKPKGYWHRRVFGK